MARIELKWDTPRFNMYEGANPANLYSSLPDSYGQAGKPTLVYLTSSLPDDEQLMKNVEGTCFRDENVQIGGTMFQQMKLDGNKIRDTHPFWKILGGHDLPRMVVVDQDGAKVGSVEGKDVSPSKVFALMKRAASRTYRTDLETVVKETKSILTAIDQIEAKRSALATKKASSTVAKEREWAEEEKALDAQMKEIETREAELKRKWNEARKVAKA